MKLDEFLKNPLGKGAIMPGRDLMVDNLNYRLQSLMKRKELKINIYTSGNDVFYHFLIPTESDYKENDYDVIIKFKPVEKSNMIDKSYKQYGIEFFSNCPSFTYGYAYVANLNGYLINEFADKYEDKVLKYPPVSRNPGLVFGYEKSIYFACKYLSDNKHILIKSYVESNSKPLSKQILKEIRHMNLIEEQIKREEKKKKEKKNEKLVDKALTKKSKKVRNEYLNNQKSSGVNTVKKTASKKPGGNHKVQPIKKRR